jgi:nucleotide-binding universal stress UspA family protein
MAIKDILVHVDDRPSSAVRLEMAAQLAATHDAHLIGLYVVVEPHISRTARAFFPDEAIALQRSALTAAGERARDRFEDLIAHAGVRGEWRQAASQPARLAKVVAVHARYADLAVVGQADPEEDEPEVTRIMPDELILVAGRPVLVVPYVGTYSVVGERVLVAWDASRLATRAVNDALPCLEKAKKVVVLAVNPRGDGEQGHGEIPSADICLHLARHGINAEAQHTRADDVDVGNMLLSRAADEGIDLMVCGAYGHRRLRELVLGGVTRHLLNHMTMPVLMSH